jgi:XRE family transcriptional regulator, aerobic/anaerobic benzoate catabolism transcriptional regulator
VSSVDEKNMFLVALGERVRALRSRRGMTRKSLALAADVSERHLANLETGVGNASILVLLQVAHALQCSVAEIIGDMTTLSTEWLMLRELLQLADEASIRQVRQAAEQILGGETVLGNRARRVALIGLRGAGKSTLGKKLAQILGFPFIEMSREIERVAGCSVAEVQALYGVSAYRRYEKRALEEVLARYEDVVIAAPGGLVSDLGTFNLLLSQCLTVWLKASPEDHMKRVVAQGDTRPIAASKEAMEDLKGILAGRAAFYSKAHLSLDTSLAGADETLAQLSQMVVKSLNLNTTKNAT